MLKIFNDIHSNLSLMEHVANLDVKPDDIFVVNGDLLGSHDPITSGNAKLFEDELEKIKAKGGKLIYLPGDEETITDAFSTFKIHDLEYINTPTVCKNALFIPTSFLDEWSESKASSIPCREKITVMVVHYPPFLSAILDCLRYLFNHEPNEIDRCRMQAVSEIIKNLPELKMAAFGHIHPNISEASLERSPLSIIFCIKNYQFIWNRPGNVLTLNNEKPPF